MKAAVLLLPIACVVASAHADSRIQTEAYDKGRVYSVYTQVGRTTLIQLEDGEALDASPSSILGMGDAAAWNLSARGNNIIFKPSQAKPQTNMVVVTNRRTYSFDLDTAPKGAQPTYILRFTYPDTDAAKAAAAAEKLKAAAAARSVPVKVNTEYSWRGDNGLLKPTSVWDDGRFTRVVYDNSAEQPVFFKVLPDGSEALVNTSMDPEEKNTVILQEVIRTVRARLGNDVIEIVNNNYQLPSFNVSGTGVPGATRENKQGTRND